MRSRGHETCLDAKRLLVVAVVAAVVPHIVRRKCPVVREIQERDDNVIIIMFYCYKKYTNEARVFGVSGYSMTLPEQLLRNYQYDVYFNPRISSWGWATWRDRWQLHSRDLHGVVGECLRQGISLEQGGSDVPNLIHNQIFGNARRPAP